MEMSLAAAEMSAKEAHIAKKLVGRIHGMVCPLSGEWFRIERRVCGRPSDHDPRSHPRGARVSFETAARAWSSSLPRSRRDVVSAGDVLGENIVLQRCLQ